MICRNLFQQAELKLLKDHRLDVLLTALAKKGEELERLTELLEELGEKVRRTRLVVPSFERNGKCRGCRENASENRALRSVPVENIQTPRYFRNYVFVLIRCA